jgi:antitoxin VapB
MAAILEQIDRVPDRPDAFDPVEWDYHGLPR